MFNFYVDAAGDMAGEELSKNGLKLAPSKLVCDGQDIDLGQFESPETTEKVIAAAQSGKIELRPLSSEEWFDFFETDISRGIDVIFFSISYNLRADNGRALKAAFADLNKVYPNSKAILVDTRTFSRGTSEIAALAKLVYDKNHDIDEALDFAETVIGKFVSLIALDSMENLRQSPLFGPLASQFSGSTLNLKPIVSIDTEGKIRLFDKAKGYRAAISKLYSNVKLNGLNVADYTLGIVSFGTDNDAQQLYDRFRKIVTENEIHLVKMSPITAILCGGKCISLTFHSKY